ncbi:mitochondrial import inner membrane translocase subunit Tim12p [[Candida] anglica]|uniref:Mitochondrial import inner membrane translocase subunit n=1 Tax=[Candida] anglica TaxID=148631 RepID=A0ABP0ECR4_9ASCO
MSLFIGASQQYSYAQVDPEKIKIAEIQHAAMSSTFNKVIQVCRDKCIPGEYGENELNTGEQCCVDRCVSKYVKANTIIGTHIQNKGFTPYDSMPEYQGVRAKITQQQ